MADRTPIAHAPATVAVFDVELPTGVAFARSLARAGVPFRAYSSVRVPAGRLSRHVHELGWCPPVDRVDEFVDWVGEESRRGSFDLVAPTSDLVSFNCAEASERDPGFVGVGTPAEAIRRCLFKDRFASAMEAAGFPVPEWATPKTVEQALSAAELLGYPVLLKPRTHAGVGVARGRVVTSPDSLRQLFVPYPVRKGRSLATARDECLALPLMQRYYPPDAVDVVSISGCLGEGGRPLVVGTCRKLTQWPRRLGLGTAFEPTPPPPFVNEALQATAALLERGLFELEVLVDRQTGDHWAIDLNPRAFGQISLDIALGRDLPVIWYNSMTGAEAPSSPARRRPPAYWHHGVPTHVSTMVGLVRGPDRPARARAAATHALTPHVGVIADWRDPAPAAVFGLQILRHPRRLLRTMVKDTEVV